MERPLFLLAYVQEMCRQCAGMLKLQHTRSSAAYDMRFHPPRSKCTSFLCFKRRASESTRCPRFGGKPPFFFFFFLCQTTCFRFTSGLRVQRLADVLVMAGGLHHPCVCVCVYIWPLRSSYSLRLERFQTSSICPHEFVFRF